MYRIISIIYLLLFGSWALPTTGYAQNLKLIQDTEIEDALKTFAAPIFRAANLNSSSVEIYIVNNDSLNAFVTGGQKLFINTGLLLRCERANQIIGVIAHETGHIAGGHLSRVHNALSRTSTQAFLSTILGGVASLATGRGDLGAAIIAGGQNTATRNFLAYNRTQEGAADHAALGFLDKTGQSARGLLEFMRFLEDQELLSVKRQDPYVRSHPLSRDRIFAIKNHIKSSPFSDTTDTPDIQEIFKRIKAKLFAYLRPYNQTIRAYPLTDQSLAAQYAHAIAEFKRSNLEKALTLMDFIIQKIPRDPYFHEMKGQMLLENGRTREAMQSYMKAVQLLPEAPYIRRNLARTQIDLGDTKNLDSAIANLKIAVTKDRYSAINWRFLAIALGRQGYLLESYLALGEEALLNRKPRVAILQANRAKIGLKRGSRKWLQAEDILGAAEELTRSMQRRSNNK